MATLTLSYKGVSLKVFPLEGERMTIGRRSDNHICLNDASVSGLHAVLSLQPDPYLDGHQRVTLVDFNSTNGVFVNGRKVRQQQLAAGDIITLGEHQLLFEQQDSAPFERTAVILPDGE